MNTKQEFIKEMVKDYESLNGDLQAIIEARCMQTGENEEEILKNIHDRLCGLNEYTGMKLGEINYKEIGMSSLSVFKDGKEVAFGLVNKVRIQGNTIAGSSKLEAGIQLAYQTTNNNVALIKDNFVESSFIGITHQAGGSGSYNRSIVKDNIYLSVDTDEQLARFNLLP